MSQWKTDDSAANSVNWVADSINAGSGKANQAANNTALFHNTTPSAFKSNMAIGQFGVSPAQKANTSGESQKVASTGWAVRKAFYGGVDNIVIIAGGSGYTNSDTVVVSNSAAVNAAANVVTTRGANLAGNVSITSGQANLVGTGTAFNTNLANGYTVFLYSNSSNIITAKLNQVVNATFANITTTWGATNTAITGYGVDGILSSFVVTSAGSGFFSNSQSVANVAITSTNGTGANVTVVLGGRAGRVQYETIVAGGMATSNNTTLPS